jgi:1-acyl-sn-glycerol-3-phosphate acyltransferase
LPGEALQEREGPPRLQPPRFTQRLAYSLLSLLGWRVNVRWPPEPRGVIVVYPHTSNWDFPVGIVARYALGLPVHWLGKDSLFRGPLGRVFRKWGGIPVNRRESTGFIGQLQAAFAAHPWMWIVITPEGTRSRTDYWKSGFYHLARAADVPVGLAYIDFHARVVGLTEYLRMTGDVAHDLDRIRAAYAGKVGKTPENAGDIRFREESGRPADDN